MKTTIPDIRFFDFDFKLLHTENEFLSSNWTIYYNDIGTFEAHFDLNSDTLPIVMDNDYLVAVQGNLSAVVVGKKLADELVIYGRTCNWLLTKRMIDAFDTTTGAIDEVLQEKVEAAFWDSPLVAVNTVSNLPMLTTSRADKCETFSLVQESLQLANLGHKLEFDPVNSLWIFKILKGNEDNPLVISTVNRNAYDVSIENDSLNLCNEGWYQKQYQNMGEWDPEVNKLLDSDGNIVSGAGIKSGTEDSPVPSNFGKCWKVQFRQDATRTSYKRFDLLLHAGDFVVCDNETGILKKSDKADTYWVKISMPSANAGILRWESLLSASSEEEAIAELYHMQSTNQVQGKTVGLRFGNEGEYTDNQCDYTLGDIVSVEWQSGKYKKRTKKRIVGVNLWYEAGNIGEEPILEDI